MSRRIAPFAALLVCLATPAALAATTVFGPSEFTVQAGKPQPVVATFVADTGATCGGRARYVLVVENPGLRVNSATVQWNGATLLGEQDFPGAERREYAAPVAASNELAVTVRGGANAGRLRIAVERRIEEPVIAPVLVASKGDPITQSFTVNGTADRYAIVLRNASARPSPNASIRINGAAAFTVAGRDYQNTAVFRDVTLPAGTNTMTVGVNGAAGASVEWQVLRELADGVCGSIAIAIDSPADSSTVSTRRISVSGTAIGPRDVGITVNGVPAQIDLTRAGTHADPLRWYATVQAAPGNVQLVATASTTTGATATATRSVAFTPAAETVLLTAAPESGAVPLKADFDLATTVTGAIARYEADLDGDGVFEISRTERPEALTFTYQTPGTRTATARVTTADGRVFTSSTAVIAQPFTVVDALLRQTWSHFVDALAAGDVDAAVAQIAGTHAQSKYRKPLTAIGARLPQFAATLADLRPIWITGRAAHYLLVRTENGTPFGYHVYFVRGDDGVWRVIQF